MVSSNRDLEMIGTQPREIATKTQSAAATTFLKDGTVDLAAMQAENERLRGLVVQLTEIILRNIAGRK
jgi:hypothetical protein